MKNRAHFFFFYTHHHSNAARARKTGRTRSARASVVLQTPVCLLQSLYLQDVSLWRTVYVSALLWMQTRHFRRFLLQVKSFEMVIQLDAFIVKELSEMHIGVFTELQ